LCFCEYESNGSYRQVICVSASMKAMGHTGKSMKHASKTEHIYDLVFFGAIIMQLTLSLYENE